MAAPEEFGSYLVYEQLGVGGMASVHVAESRSAGGFRKRCALKRLLPHAVEQPALVESFINEARLARYLRHTNIAQVYDFGKIGREYFIAMELVQGPTLGQLIRQCASTIGVIPFPITLNILVQLCEALEYAHGLCDEAGKPLGLIHRDVSPPNVIISHTGLVKLIDFGIAKTKFALGQTAVGMVKGKFSYIAPEYLAGNLDHRVDLWAIGVVAYELLTTKQLFDADDDFAVLDRVRTMRIEPPSRLNPDIPRELDAVVMAALDRDVARRWQSAGAMRTALANVAAELQTIVSNDQLVQWVEWVFTQAPPGEYSELSKLISLLEQPSRPGVRVGVIGDKSAERAPAPAATGDRPKARSRREPAPEPEVRSKREPAPEPEVVRRIEVKVKSTRPRDEAARAEPRPLRGNRRASLRRIFVTPRVGEAMVSRRNKGGNWFVIVCVITLVLVAAAYVLSVFGFVPDVLRSL